MPYPKRAGTLYSLDMGVWGALYRTKPGCKGIGHG